MTVKVLEIEFDGRDVRAAQNAFERRRLRAERIGRGGAVQVYRIYVEERQTPSVIGWLSGHVRSFSLRAVSASETELDMDPEPETEPQLYFRRIFGSRRLKEHDGIKRKRTQEDV